MRDRLAFVGARGAGTALLRLCFADAVAVGDERLFAGRLGEELDRARLRARLGLLPDPDRSDWTMARRPLSLHVVPDDHVALSAVLPTVAGLVIAADRSREVLEPDSTGRGHAAATSETTACALLDAAYGLGRTHGGEHQVAQVPCLVVWTKSGVAPPDAKPREGYLTSEAVLRLVCRAFPHAAAVALEATDFWGGDASRRDRKATTVRAFRAFWDKLETTS